MSKFYSECWYRIQRAICEAWSLILVNVLFLIYWAYRFFSNTIEKDENIYFLVLFLVLVLITRFIKLFSRPGSTKDCLLAPLFRYSYGFMFLALLLSIGPFIHSGQSADPQHHAPIGLVRGCSIDTDVALDLQCASHKKTIDPGMHSTDKQLMDSMSAVDTLQGSILDVESKRRELSVAQTVGFSDKEKLKSARDTLLKAEQMLHQAVTQFQGSSAANLQWLFNIGGRVTCGKYYSDTCEVTGGLVVPLYFIVLALLGGAISLTRRVPEYQKRSAENYQAIDNARESFMSYEQVRESLAFQIIQFISAPLIAIVAYQLIEPTNQAGVVVLGFIAGFSSEVILKMIRQLTNKMTPEKMDLSTPTGSIAGLVTKNGAGMAGAKVTLVGVKRLSVETNEKGHFLIKNTPAGERVVEVSDNKNSKLEKVTIEQGEAAQCPTITFP